MGAERVEFDGAGLDGGWLKRCSVLLVDTRNG